MPPRHRSLAEAGDEIARDPLGHRFRLRGREREEGDLVRAGIVAPGVDVVPGVADVTGAGEHGEDRAVAKLPAEIEHLRALDPEVDRHVRAEWFEAELDVAELVEAAIVVAGFAGEKRAGDL